MRLILAPAKNMRPDTDGLEPRGLPRFIDSAQTVFAWLQTLDRAELQRLWSCNDSIAELNYERLQRTDLTSDLTPAILAYDGIAFKYMAPTVFEDAHLAYVQDHLCILSGLYGVLRPMDGVVPYRLEMQAKANVNGTRDLYEFWGSRIHDAVYDGEATVVNLASKEYSRCVESHLQPAETLVTCIFGELNAQGRVVQKGTYAKMARGEMVRFAAETNALEPQDLQPFDRLGYCFDPVRSNETTYVFVRNGSRGQQLPMPAGGRG